MLAERFLDELEARGMLESEVLADLRRQVSEMDRGVTPEAIAKLLVDHGHLTKFQATKLVTDVTKPLESKREKKAQERAVKKSKVTEEELVEEADDEEIVDLVASSDAPAPAPVEEPAGLTPIADAGLTPIEDAGLTPIEDAGLVPMDGAAGGLQPLDAGGLTPLDAAGGMDQLSQPASQAAPAEQEQATSAAAAKAAANDAGGGGKWGGILIIAGSGLLLLLLMVGAILYFSLSGGNAQVYFDKGLESYQSQSYTQSIQDFEAYMEAYPTHKDISRAKVMHGLARIRLVKGKTKPEDAKARIELVLMGGAEEGQVALLSDEKILEDKEAMTQTRDELPSLIVDVLDGCGSLAKNAEAIADKEKYVALYQATFDELWGNPDIVPTSKRKVFASRIKLIQEDVDLAKYDISEAKELAIALDKIDEAVAAADTQEAFRVRADFLNRYPRKENDEGLVTATRAIADKERDLVKIDDQPIQPRTEEVGAESGHRSVLVTNRIGGVVQSANDNEVLFILAEGTVYGLKASDGTVLWHHSVGFNTTFHPVPVNDQQGADAIVVSGDTNEVLRLQAATGELVWACPVGEPMNDPVVRYDQIMVSTKSGKIIKVDPASGQAGPVAQLPQKMIAGPGFDKTRPQYYAVGEHSNLYLLSRDTLDCNDVIYIGHKPGTIEVPPTLAVGMLFIPENVSPSRTELHVYRVNVDGVTLERAQASIRLAGNVITPPLIVQRRVIFVTDRREIHIFNIDPNNKKEPVTVLASQPASLSSPMVTHLVVRDSTLFIGDRRLAKHEIRLTTSELQTPYIVNEGDVFDGPLHMVGEAVVHQRRPKLGAGMTITAAAIDDEAKPIWTTYLGQPVLSATLNQEDKAIDVLTSGAALFRVTQDQLSSDATLDTPFDTEGAGVGIFDTVLDMGDSKQALYSTTDQTSVIVYDPQATTTRLRQTRLNMSGARVGGPAMHFADGLLLPLASGEVTVLNYQTGAPKMAAFLPPREPGETVRWARPALVQDGKEFVISDDKKNIFRVGLSPPNTPPALKQLASAVLTTGLGDRLAASGDQVYGVLPDPSGDLLLRFNKRNLKQEQELALQGKVFWGPEAVGGRVFVGVESMGTEEAAPDAEEAEGPVLELLCLDGSDKPLWKSALPYGKLTGLPLAQGSDFILASLSGVVCKISGDTGEEISKVETGESLKGSPVVFGNVLMLPGAGGALHMVPIPK